LQPFEGKETGSLKSARQRKRKAYAKNERKKKRAAVWGLGMTYSIEGKKILVRSFVRGVQEEKRRKR